MRKNSFSTLSTTRYTRYTENGNGDEYKKMYKTEKSLFNLYMNPDTKRINMGHFLLALEKMGLRRSDPRLQELMKGLQELHLQIGDEGTTPESMELPFESFRKLIDPNLVLLSQAFSQKLIIPDFLEFCSHLKDIFRRCKQNAEVSYVIFTILMVQFLQIKVST